jgi:hypothetical protein
MTTTPAGAPGGDLAGGPRIEMRAEARDASTLTQIGTQVNQAPPLPDQAFRPWAELAAPAGLSNLPVRPRLFVGRATELARLDAALAGPGGVVVQAVHGLGGIDSHGVGPRLVCGWPERDGELEFAFMNVRAHNAPGKA